MAKRKESKSIGAKFEAFSKAITQFTGSTAAFGIALGVVVVWALVGPLFGFSDTWQLVINTGTTIVTFLMVFLIQRIAEQGRAGDSPQAERARGGDAGREQPADRRRSAVRKRSCATLERHYSELAAARARRTRRHGVALGRGGARAPSAEAGRGEERRASGDHCDVVEYAHGRATRRSTSPRPSISRKSTTRSTRRARKSASATTSRARRPRSTLNTTDKTLTLIADDEMKMNALWEIVQTRLVRRGVPIKNFKAADSRAGGRRHGPARDRRFSRASRSRPRARSSSSSRTRN